jgi:hypothetical protein
MSEIIPFIKPAKEERKCSFCNTPESQCTHMFSNGADGGQKRNICGSCVKHAKKRKDGE